MPPQLLLYLARATCIAARGTQQQQQPQSYSQHEHGDHSSLHEIQLLVTRRELCQVLLVLPRTTASCWLVPRLVICKN
jgi:hypothetical protein